MEKEIKIDDKYVGRYRVENKMVYVSSVYGEKTTQLGDSPAETIARLLLGELVSEYQKNKQINN